MECPHLEECVRLGAPSVLIENGLSEWCCSVCKTTKSLWLCLNCGVINCGRYVNAHAKEHHENPASENHHSVCLDCDTLAAFCYICDEFVINDTPSQSLTQIRDCINSHASTNNHINHVKENCENSKKENCENSKKENCENSKKENIENSKNCENSKRRKLSDADENSRKKVKTEGGVKIKPKTSGLRNLGNTCFMNAVLQSLSNIQSFCGYIKQLPSLENKMAKKKVHVTRSNNDTDNVFLIEELRKILVQLWQGGKSIYPESLFSVIWKVVPRFRGYQQQDAHEFMRYLLDRLHTELLTLLPYPNQTSAYIGPKGKSTIVTAIFGGILQNEVNCLICGTESKKHDPFLDLSLDIPNEFVRTTKPKEGEPPVKCHISDCLSSFIEVEYLEESELYRCNNCKKKQRSTKRFWIRRLPNVLCLHLKRFRWNCQFRTKVDTFVEFPLKGLDMNTFVLNMHETRNTFGGSNEYDLAAVIVHHGSGAGSGHYTSYAIHEGRWYHFNDSTVSACDEETVGKCKAYILFYVRRELRLPEYLTVKS